MPVSYLDKDGLEYFWSKLKIYIDQHSGGGGGIGDGVPVGMIMDFAGSTAPSGYLVCDGSAVSRTIYSELFAAIGTTWGAGDGSTTFNLPDFRGRTSIGSGTGTASDATAHALGSTGGEEKHTLTVSELAEHAHQPTTTEGWKFYGIAPDSTGLSKYNLQIHSSGANRYTYATTESSGGFTNWSWTATRGGSSPHNIMQPFATVNKIIKAIPDGASGGSGIDMSTASVSLGTTGWSNNSKTVNVTDVTSSNVVIIAPAPADADAWAAAGIVCTAQGSGTLTFGCDTVPSTSLTANVLIFDEGA